MLMLTKSQFVCSGKVLVRSSVVSSLEYLGYRSIFWFLAILAGISLFLIPILPPRTLRTVAGNGSVPLHGIYKPWIYYITRQTYAQEDAKPSGAKKKVTWKTVLAPLTFLGEKDVFITLFFGAIVYTVWSMVTSSTSDIFSPSTD